jgi:methyl-accepting chemotaxis protein
MRWYRDLSMGWKLQLGFGAVSVLAAAMGIMGFLAVGSMQKQVDGLFERHAVGLAYLKEANIQSLFISRELRDAILDESAADVDACAQSIQGRDREFRRTFDEYRSRVKQQKNKELSAKALAAYDRAWQFRLATLELARDNRDAEAQAKMSEASAAVVEMESIIDQLQAEKMDNMLKSAAGLVAAGRATRARLVVTCVLIVLLSTALGLALTRTVATALRHVVGRAKQAATGDLTVRVELDTKDELGQMGRALNVMMERFETSMVRVRDAAENTATAAQELASGSESLSSGAQEQASALEETAASLEQMTASVKQNAAHAVDADTRAAHTREGAERGGEVVRQAVVSMDALSKAAHRISDISTTIDEIAFQTNLLALNASVEAARAGEQGRGFAVVAGEVRTLAQRTADASREIRALIGDSVKQVEESTTLVNRAGDTLEGIVRDVRAVADLVGDISASSREQSAGIEQVNKAITQMDQVTQDYASRTEELSSTAQALSDHSNTMREQVAQFQMSESAG